MTDPATAKLASLIRAYRLSRNGMAGILFTSIIPMWVKWGLDAPLRLGDDLNNPLLPPGWVWTVPTLTVCGFLIQGANIAFSIIVTDDWDRKYGRFPITENFKFSPTIFGIELATIVGILASSIVTLVRQQAAKCDMSDWSIRKSDLRCVGAPLVPIWGLVLAGIYLLSNVLHAVVGIQEHLAHRPSREAHRGVQK